MSSSVWVFTVPSRPFPGAVFTSFALAEAWIRKHRLTGTLTNYPLDVGVYDWALASGRFEVKKPQHESPEFIGGFSTAYQEHFHYTEGSR